MMTEVAIVGGGPAGLMLAIELGCRDVPCIVFDENTKPPHLPKANATSARTMEHYRRRGFADQVRALGLPAGHPQDIVYTTRLAQHELTRFHIPSSDQAASQESFGDYREEAWPTPELPHRVQQMFIEPILKVQAERYPSVRMCFGQRVTAVHDEGERVRVEAADVLTGATTTTYARYAIGCDGARSLVRQAMGTAYSGTGGAEREFLGGQMVSLYFRSAELYDILGKGRAWQYWAVNPEQRGLMCAINGTDSFVLMIQLKKGESADDVDVDAVFRAAMGATFPYVMIAETPWNAGYALVANTFRKGRLMVAGDAAHLFTPTGGMGYNTSIDDVVNLGWKLAAVLQGWAPESLLDTYEAERRPTALRNTAFAGSMADSIGRLPVTPLVEQDGAEADAARERLGQALANHVASEFNIPGVQLGVRYTSAIVATEPTAPPPDEFNRYVPGGYPGTRAPHVRIGTGSLLDLFGRDFTLLVLGAASSAAWEAAAKQLRVPLTVVRSDDAATRALYDAELVLVRPDHHIAWRGNGSSNPQAVLAAAIGRPAHETSEEADIHLRDIIESDLPIFFEQQLDPLANHMAAFTSADPGDERDFRKHWEQILRDESITKKTITLGSAVAGNIASFERDGVREATYWIGKEYWGKGVATKALTEFLMQMPGRPLHARVAKDNLASLRVLEKCGFSIVGEDRGFANARGCETEEFILAVD